MKTPERITVNEFSLILNISEATIKKLAKTKQIPSINEKNRLYFDFETVLAHFQRLEGGAA